MAESPDTYRTPLRPGPRPDALKTCENHGTTNGRTQVSGHQGGHLPPNIPGRHPPHPEVLGVFIHSFCPITNPVFWPKTPCFALFSGCATRTGGHPDPGHRLVPVAGNQRVQQKSPCFGQKHHVLPTFLGARHVRKWPNHRTRTGHLCDPGLGPMP